MQLPHTKKGAPRYDCNCIPILGKLHCNELRKSLSRQYSSNPSSVSFLGVNNQPAIKLQQSCNKLKRNRFVERGLQSCTVSDTVLPFLFLFQFLLPTVDTLSIALRYSPFLSVASDSKTRKRFSNSCECRHFKTHRGVCKTARDTCIWCISHPSYSFSLLL